MKTNFMFLDNVFQTYSLFVLFEPVQAFISILQVRELAVRGGMDW